MLLTLTATRPPATDLGFLLHKHPGKAQAYDLAFGTAHVVYPEATPDRCTAALWVEVDPVRLVRGPGGDGLLDQYVNDRPYAASSLLSVAIARVYGTALAGRCRDRPELAAEAMPLAARLPAVPSRGGPAALERLFAPLGYAVRAERHPLDPAFPEWGEGPYHAVELSGTCRLADLLSHLYVLIPVLDGDKHYWVGDAEVEKLLKHGEGWLGAHPEREWIARRYLKHRGGLVRGALARLADDADDAPGDDAEEAAERPVRLDERRREAVVAALLEGGPRRVLDLGCGEGKLVRRLLDEPSVAEVVGVDVSVRALGVARERLGRLPPDRAGRATLLHGSLVYRDARLAGFDAAAVVEVVEHLDPPRLAAFERAVFAEARPGRVVLTTPNAEYNAAFGMPAGAVRHADHRFEWTRAEFRAWAGGVADRHGYRLEVRPVGDEDGQLGPPTQMGVFAR